MARRNFYEIITETPYNPLVEYNRIYGLFYDGNDECVPAAETIDENFRLLPCSIKGRTVSLSDFDETYGFDFPRRPSEITADELVSFCEYVWNLCFATHKHAWQALHSCDQDFLDSLLGLIKSCMADFYHMPVKLESFIIFVPQKAEVVAVAEIVPKETAINVLEYHHHSLKGNLSKKKAILKVLADDIEPQRSSLNSLNKAFANSLFQMLQKFVRHNNDSNAYISGLAPNELEACYDDIYQMWLLAKLQLDHYPARKERVEEVLNKIKE